MCVCVRVTFCGKCRGTAVWLWCPLAAVPLDRSHTHRHPSPTHHLKWQVHARAHTQHTHTHTHTHTQGRTYISMHQRQQQFQTRAAYQTQQTAVRRAGWCITQSRYSGCFCWYQWKCTRRRVEMNSEPRVWKKQRRSSYGNSPLNTFISARLLNVMNTGS